MPGGIRAAAAWADAPRGLQFRPAAAPVATVTGRFQRRPRRDDADDRDPRVMLAVDRAKAGDPEALRFLYATYAGNVYGFVLSIVRDEHDAEDVTQQVF